MAIYWDRSTQLRTDISAVTFHSHCLRGITAAQNDVWMMQIMGPPSLHTSLHSIRIESTMGSKEARNSGESSIQDRVPAAHDAGELVPEHGLSCAPRRRSGVSAAPV